MDSGVVAGWVSPKVLIPLADMGAPVPDNDE